MHLLTNIIVVISLCSPWTEAELAGGCSCNAGWHELECWLVRALLRVNLKRLILMITNRFCFSDTECYTYSCRCGGEFILDQEDNQEAETVVCCDSCSLSIEVQKVTWNFWIFCKFLIGQLLNSFSFGSFHGHNTQMFTGRIISRPQSRDLPLFWLEWFFCKNDLRAIRNGVYKRAHCTVFRCQVGFFFN